MNRYIDDYGMLLNDWSQNQGRGDALWRSSLYAIINPEHTSHLYACFKDGRVYRHPLDRLKDYNTCSRDQTVMAITAFKLNNRSIPKINYRISDKFTMGDTWIWYRAIVKGRKGILFITLWRILLPILFKLNDLLWWYGHKTKIPMDFNPPKDSGEKKNIYWRWRFPFYAFHLLSWMVYCLPDSRAKRKLNRKCRGEVAVQDISNLLLFKLHGMKQIIDEVIEMDMANIKPRNDFRWQRRLDRMPPGIKLREYDGPFQIDVDILKAI